MIVGWRFSACKAKKAIPSRKGRLKCSGLLVAFRCFQYHNLPTCDQAFVPGTLCFFYVNPALGTGLLSLVPSGTDFFNALSPSAIFRYRLSAIGYRLSAIS